VPNQPENLFIGYFYSNNKDQKYIGNNNNNYNQKYSKNNYEGNNFNLIKGILLVIFIAIIILLVWDFYPMYKKVKRENKIERDKCNEEYLANKCNEMNIDDGPLINDFCYEKKKCMEFEIFFHEILIRYIKNVIFHIIKGSNIFNTVITLITILIIFRILF
jgi:hypothetical protein